MSEDQPKSVMAVDDYKDNADLIVACVALRYITDPVLDCTYGLGRFWRKHTPLELTMSDLHPRNPAVVKADFTDLPWVVEQFATVVFDPPYKLNGTGGSHPSDEAYGVADRYGTGWRGRHRLICDGITECERVLAPKGWLLVKCQDQVCGGKVRWQTREFADHGESLGLRLVDALHLLGYRAQPSGRRQVHARRNYSTMLVFGKS